MKSNTISVYKFRAILFLFTNSEQYYFYLQVQSNIISIYKFRAILFLFTNSEQYYLYLQVQSNIISVYKFRSLLFLFTNLDQYYFCLQYDENNTRPRFESGVQICGVIATSNFRWHILSFGSTAVVLCLYSFPTERNHSYQAVTLLSDICSSKYCIINHWQLLVSGICSSNSSIRYL